MSKQLYFIGLWSCLCTAQQGVAQVNATSIPRQDVGSIESMMDLWWQYSEYHEQLEEDVQEAYAENLRMHLHQNYSLCTPMMSDVFEVFYMHTSLLLQLHEDHCIAKDSFTTTDSVFVEQVLDIPFVGEFMSSYVLLAPKVQTIQNPRKHRDIQGALGSTFGFSKPIPRRGVSIDSSSQWVGTPSRQKHRLRVHGPTTDLRLSLQKNPGESLGLVPWQSWVAGGLQLDLPASNITLTLGQFRHQSPSRLLSSGSLSPLSNSTYQTTLRPHPVSTSREPYHAMKGISVFSRPSSNSQVRLSFSHRLLYARSLQGDTLHAPTTSVNWTTRQGLKAQQTMTQTSLLLDGAAKLGLHRVSVAWNVHFHSDWVAQRDGYLWSTSPFHGVEIGWSGRFSSQSPLQTQIMGFAAIALHHAPRLEAPPFDGILMGGFHLTRDAFRAKVSVGWASSSWLSPVGGTLTSLDDPIDAPAPRIKGQIDLDLRIESFRLGLTHMITHHQQVLTQPMKQSLKIYAQLNLPANTKLHGVWSSGFSNEQRWTTSLPYTLIEDATQIQRASLTAYTSVGRHRIRLGGRWIANSAIWNHPSTGWFVRVHSNLHPFQSSLQWSAWTPIGSQTSILLGQPSIRGATGLLSHTGHSSSLVGVLQMPQPVSAEVSLSLELRIGVQELFNQGYKGSGLESRPGTRHVWTDLHVSLEF